MQYQTTYQCRLGPSGVGGFKETRDKILCERNNNNITVFYENECMETHCRTPLIWIYEAVNVT